MTEIRDRLRTADHVDRMGVLDRQRHRGPGRTSPHRPHRLALVLFLTFLDNTIVSVVLANVQSSLHAGVNALQWVVNGYAVSFAGLMLTFGTLGDLFGRKKVMLGGVAVFCAGSVVCALAPHVQVLIVGRVLMGVGAAASEPGTLSMIRHLYTTRGREHAPWASGWRCRALPWPWAPSSAGC